MTPKQQYDADRNEHSPEWDRLAPETREAYERGAPRFGFLTRGRKAKPEVEGRAA